MNIIKEFTFKCANRPEGTRAPIHDAFRKLISKKNQRAQYNLEQRTLRLFPRIHLR